MDVPHGVYSIISFMAAAVLVVLKHFVLDSRSDAIFDEKLRSEKENREKLEMGMRASQVVLENMRATYISRSEFSEIKAEIKADIKELENRIMSAITMIKRRDE